jgi:hypothetical protein
MGESPVVSIGLRQGDVGAGTQLANCWRGAICAKLAVGSAGSHGDVAQSVEHLLCKQGVGGSSPLVSTRSRLNEVPAEICAPGANNVCANLSP